MFLLRAARGCVAGLAAACACTDGTADPAVCDNLFCLGGLATELIGVRFSFRSECLKGGSDAGGEVVRIDCLKGCVGGELSRLCC